MDQRRQVSNDSLQPTSQDTPRSATPKTGHAVRLLESSLEESLRGVFCHTGLLLLKLREACGVTRAPNGLAAP